MQALATGSSEQTLGNSAQILTGARHNFSLLIIEHRRSLEAVYFLAERASSWLR